MNGLVIELPPESGMLVDFPDGPVDYADRFAAPAARSRLGRVDDLVTAWFSRQPTWVRLVSTNTLSRRELSEIVARGRYEVDDTIGSWRVVARSETEIVFADSLGFMEFRFGFRVPGAEAELAEVATVVRYRWRLGRWYFAVVRPFHRRFVRRELDRAVAPVRA